MSVTGGCDVKGSTSSKEQKHIEIDNALVRLYETRDKVQDLQLRITGECTPDGPCDPSVRSTPSLSLVLVDTPERIHRACDDISDTIHRITETLY